MNTLIKELNKILVDFLFNNISKKILLKRITQYQVLIKNNDLSNHLKKIIDLINNSNVSKIRKECISLSLILENPTKLSTYKQENLKKYDKSKLLEEAENLLKKL